MERCVISSNPRGATSATPPMVRGLPVHGTLSSIVFRFLLYERKNEKQKD